MTDPHSHPSGRRNPNAPLWGMVMVFVVVMVGLATYGYATHTWESSATSTQQSEQSSPAKQ